MTRADNSSSAVNCYYNRYNLLSPSFCDAQAQYLLSPNLSFKPGELFSIVAAILF